MSTRTKSVEFARCPKHTANPAGHQGGLTGLILTADGLVFRDHTKRIGNTTIPCPGSGTTHNPNPNPANSGQETP